MGRSEVDTVAREGDVGWISGGVEGHGAGFAVVEPHRPGVGPFVDGSEHGVDRVGDGCCTMTCKVDHCVIGIHQMVVTCFFMPGVY